MTPDFTVALISCNDCMPRVNLPVAQQLPSVPSMETINGVAAVDAEDLARDVISRRHGQVRHGRRHLLHATSGSWGKKRLAGHSEPVYCVLSASSMAFLRFRSRARDHVWALVFIFRLPRSFCGFVDSNNCFDGS